MVLEILLYPITEGGDLAVFIYRLRTQHTRGQLLKDIVEIKDRTLKESPVERSCLCTTIRRVESLILK
jgi:hypothetical protein